MVALWMIISSLLFALMGVCVKFAAEGFTSAEMIFYRGLIGIVLIWLFASVAGVSLKTQVPQMHAWRAVIGVVSLGTWFYAITHLPLATANSLNYMSSVWIAAFMIAGQLMSWKPARDDDQPSINAGLVLTVLMGFAGVVLLLRPTLSSDQLFAGVIGVLSGIASAFVYMQIVMLSRAGEPETRTVFYFAIGSTIGGAAAMLVTGFSPWSWSAAAWLLSIGVLTPIAQWCMTRAYAGATENGGTLMVANLQYSGIIFSVAFGYFFFNEYVDFVGWIGIALVIASGIGATVIRTRSMPVGPAEEH
ncbi:MAG: DMT family transporter [Parvibaculum sp.]|nr:DMT family transporter [Parvibaculum sp.]